jgi:hypothetical protein
VKSAPVSRFKVVFTQKIFLQIVNLILAISSLLQSPEARTTDMLRSGVNDKMKVLNLAFY